MAGTNGVFILCFPVCCNPTKQCSQVVNSKVIRTRWGWKLYDACHSTRTTLGRAPGPFKGAPKKCLLSYVQHKTYRHIHTYYYHFHQVFFMLLWCDWYKLEISTKQSDKLEALHSKDSHSNFAVQLKRPNQTYSNMTDYSSHLRLHKTIVYIPVTW